MHVARTNSKHPGRAKPYHLPTCDYVRGLLNRAVSLRPFNSRREAEAAGFRPCRRCIDATPAPVRIAPGEVLLSRKKC